MQPLDRVVRVQLYRSVRSTVRAGSAVSLEVMYVSEFCEAAPASVAADHDVVATFLTDGERHEVPSACEAVCTKEHMTVYRVRFPETPGRYQLLLQPRLRLQPPAPTSAVYVLPLLTDAFNVVLPDDATDLASASPLLTCFRPVAGLTVREEYGRTIGSHVYDSSVVMLRFLSACVDARSKDGAVAPSSSHSSSAAAVAAVGPSDVVLELGAGCGLVSLWMARHLPGRVLATDLEQQLPILRDNIARNAGTDNGISGSGSGSSTPLTVARLNWTELRATCNVTATAAGDDGAVAAGATSLQEERARRAFQQEHLGLSAADDFALIVACDVLYDRSLAVDFFEAVRIFSRRPPGRTTLLLAQKMRNHSGGPTTGPCTGPPAFDVAQVVGFVHRKAWEEADVVVWEMWLVVDGAQCSE